MDQQLSQAMEAALEAVEDMGSPDVVEAKEQIKFWQQAKIDYFAKIENEAAADPFQKMQLAKKYNAALAVNKALQYFLNVSASTAH